MSVEATTKPEEARQTLKMAKNRRKLLIFSLLPHSVGMDTAHVDHERRSEHHGGHSELAPDGQLASEWVLDRADGRLHSGAKVPTRRIHDQESLPLLSDIDLALVDVENGFA